MITHLVTPEVLAGAEVVIEDEAYRHLFRARRLALGDALRLVDGRGVARWARVEQVDRRRAVLRPGEDAPAHESAYRLELVVAALRPERASWLVEKATETGAAAVRFVASRRTPRNYGSAQLARWRRVAAAAVEQCHRSCLPEVSGVHAWEELPELLAGAAGRWYLDRDGGGFGTVSAVGTGAVLIGPEGGWTPEEKEELEGLAARPVGLGPRILRVETAALAAASLLLLAPAARA